MRFVEATEADPSARIRLLEVGAGTGGISPPVLARLRPYQRCIDEYRYTDRRPSCCMRRTPMGRIIPTCATAFSMSRSRSPGRHCSRRYDLVIAPRAAWTRNVRRTRNIKTALRANGMLLLNEICRRACSTTPRLTLAGWWLYEDEKLRIPALVPGSRGLAQVLTRGSARSFCFRTGKRSRTVCDRR